MPLSEAEATALVEQLEDDAATLHAIVHGDADAVVPTEGGNVKSVAKAIADAEAEIDAALDDATGAVGASVVKAEEWAEKAEDAEVEPGKYSAKHWAAKAEEIRDSMTNVLELKGEFDASGGSFPADPDIGDYWIVTVDGTIGAVDLFAGDEIVYGPSGWIVQGRNQSAEEILTKLKTVDGADSGLDADKLDGEEGSFYRNASNLNAGMFMGFSATEAPPQISNLNSVTGSGLSWFASSAEHRPSELNIGYLLQAQRSFASLRITQIAFSANFGDVRVFVRQLYSGEWTDWSEILTDVSAFSVANAGRLTLTSGVAVTESDVTSATAVYFTPCNGNEQSIYDGSRWVRRRFSELTLTLNNPNHAANTNYDVFIYWDATAGTLKIGTGPAWSSDTSRGTGAATTEVELLDGSLVNAEEITLRNGGTTTVVAAGLAKLVGTIRTIGTAGQSEDSASKRFVSNVYNAMPRSMKVTEAAAGWSYATAAYRYMNNSSANRIDFVSALPGRQVTAEAKGAVLGSGATLRTVVFSIGLDRADGSDATFAGGEQASSAGTRYPFAVYRGFPGEGRHFLAAVEYGGGADNQTWFGLSTYGVSGEVLN